MPENCIAARKNILYGLQCSLDSNSVLLYRRWKNTLFIYLSYTVQT